MTTFTLPSGRTVEMQAASQVTERFRRPIVIRMQAIQAAAEKIAAVTSADEVPQAEVATMFEIGDLVAVALITACSWLPGRPSADDLLDLTSADHDALLAECSPQIAAVLRGVDFDPTPDRSSPTPPSSD